MQVTTESPGFIADRALALEVAGSRPPVIGISGFGGAGKSTLASQLQQQLPGSVVVPGDEFLLAHPPAERSDDWGDVDRDRLSRQVLEPAHEGMSVKYQVWDWDARAPGPWVAIDSATAIIVEGLALYVPELVSLFDLRVWIDIDLDSATAQGMWRDEHEYGNAQAALWVEVWKPNDADFFRKFRPDTAADILFKPPNSRSPSGTAR